MFRWLHGSSVWECLSHCEPRKRPFLHPMRRKNMETNTSDTGRNICTCHHKTPGKFTFTSPPFNKVTAIRAANLDQSGTQTWDFIVEELSRHHTGQLTDINGTPFCFRSDDLKDVRAFDQSIRDDQKSHVNRIKAKARDGWKGKYRLQKRMIYPMMLLWFSLECHDCRTRGKCSQITENRD